MVRIALFLTLILFAAFAQAHHSTAGIYDSSRTIEIDGTVTFVSWRNPHSRILLAVEDESGATREWEAESAAISILRNRGLDRDFIAVGDRITIAGPPSRKNEPRVLAHNILLANGYELDIATGPPYFPAGKSGRLVGRVFDQSGVEEAIASADGIFRVWSTIMGDPEAFPMFKGGYPLTRAAEEVLAQWDPTDNDLLRCGTKGMPLIMITPFPIEFVRQGEDLLMRIEEYDARRTIHMADDAVPPEEHAQMGFSRGRWEGDSLVVETDRIAAGYFDMDGVPQSEQITLVERFTPSETYERLDYRVTVRDPVYFSAPFDLTRYFVWRPEMSVHPYECLEQY